MWYWFLCWHLTAKDIALDTERVIMIDIFSDEMRRNPFATYAQIRAASPLVRVPPPFDAWAVFDYEGVKRVMSDHEAFRHR